MRPISENDECEWEVLGDSVLHCLRTKEKYAFGKFCEFNYNIDKVYSTEAKTPIIFDDVVKNLISSTIQGMNATIFAYGQTASGKTFTVRGTETCPGLIPLSLNEIFKEISKVRDRKFKVSVSFLELYNETIHDLLVEDSDKLEIKENMHGVFVKGLSSFEVNNPEQSLQFLREGDTRKKMAETRLNVQSSRSHTVFRINVESKPADALPVAAARVSQLNLVDLAGSEGVSRTKAEGIRLREGANINKSLLALSNVIHRLSSHAGKHINFRDSKLTRLLQTALGGNSKTAIICTISQQKINYAETVNTLLFGVKAKKIKNSAKVNVVVPDTHTRYQLALKEIQKQKEELVIVREDNRQLRLMLVENAALEWDTKVNEFKNNSNSMSAQELSGSMSETIDKFTKVITDLKQSNEINRLENVSMQQELSEKSAGLAACENQISELSKIIRAKDKEIQKLKNTLEAKGLECPSPDFEEYKIEENCEQDISLVEEEDGILLMDMNNDNVNKKSRTRSLSRKKSQTQPKKSFGTPFLEQKIEFTNDELSFCAPQGQVTPFNNGSYSQINNLAIEIKELREQTKKLEKQLEESEIAKNGLTEIIQSYEKTTLNLQKDLDRSQIESKENADVVRKLVSEKVQMLIECESWRAKCDRFSEEYNKISKQSENQIKTIEDLKKENLLISVYKDQINNYESKIKEFEELKNKMTEEIKENQVKIDNLITEKNSLSLKVHNMSMHKCPKIQTVKRELEEKEGMIKRLKNEMTDWVQTKTRLSNEIENLNKKIKDMENQLEQANGRNDSLATRLKSTERHNNELIEKLEKGLISVTPESYKPATCGKRKIFEVFKKKEEIKSKKMKPEKSLISLLCGEKEISISPITPIKRQTLGNLNICSVSDKENLENIMTNRKNTQELK